jgi:hypothetical protein
MPWLETHVVADISFSINKSSGVNFLDASNNEIGNHNKEKVVKFVLPSDTEKKFPNNTIDVLSTRSPCKSKNTVIEKLNKLFENRLSNIFGETILTQTRLDNFGDIKQRIRQREMLSVVRKNISNSNFNIQDPGNFYKNWLIEIHKKKKDRIKKKVMVSNLLSMSKKLSKIQKILTESFIV